MRRGRLRQQTTSRVILAALVLTGLLAMHGVSPPMAVGCVGGSGMTTADASPVGVDHAVAVDGSHDLSAPAAAVAGTAAMVPAGGGHGDVCVATLPRSPLTAMFAFALLLITGIGFRGASPFYTPDRRLRPPRAPPWGAALLIWLGVSRT